MKYHKTFLATFVIVSIALVTAILWLNSEHQYVAMTNIGLRLRVLHQSELDGRRLSEKSLPTWETVWKPMITAMQLETRHAVMRWKGFHLSTPMYEQLSRFSAEVIDNESELKNLLSEMDFSYEVIESKAPLAFSKNAQQASLTSVDAFSEEISAIIFRENAYLDWLSPILQQQQLLDKATTCKTLKEIKSFQMYSDRIKSKCATKTNKWAVCNGKDEPIARQIRELQLSAEANLNKFKSRWLVDNVNDLCSDI